MSAEDIAAVVRDVRAGIAISARGIAARSIIIARLGGKNG